MEQSNAVALSAFRANSLRESCIGSVQLKWRGFAQAKWAPRLVRFVNKYFYRLGIGAALNRYDSSITLYSARNDRRLYNDFPADAIYCNFGSGAFQHPSWVNFDYPGSSAYYKAVQGREGTDFFPIDLCVDGLVLPYGDSSVSLIYCSHTLEHLEEHSAFKFLEECARILKPEGVMRVVVPNTDSDFDLCRTVFFQEEIGDVEKNASLRYCAFHAFTPADSLPDQDIYEDIVAADFNAERFIRLAKEKRGLSGKFNGAHPEFHLTHWNHKKFAQAAKDCGFKCYVPLYRGSTQSLPFKNIEVFDTTEPHVSLYGEFVGAK